MKSLLVVDGYNVLYKSPRYSARIDTTPSTDLYCQDPHIQARDDLVADVAAYAKGTYEAIVVFDGAHNVNTDRPAIKQAGITLLFSGPGESADTVIERLVRQAREAQRSVLLVTSDNTIRATVGQYVSKISSDTFLANIVHESQTMRCEEVVQFKKLTLEDRLDGKTREKLNKLLGR